jgi:hypothetical protein
VSNFFNKREEKNVPPSKWGVDPDKLDQSLNSHSLSISKGKNPAFDPLGLASKEDEISNSAKAKVIAQNK